MNIGYKHLRLKSIDLTDTTFVISYGFSLSLLQESIKKIGMLNPPLVKKKPGEQFRVVCGYKRLLACQDIGTQELRCAIMDHSIKERDAFLVSLHDNLSFRDLNSIEKSIAISKLQKYYPDETVVKQFLPLLQLPPHYPVLNRINLLIRLDEETKEAVIEGRLDETTAIKLLNFSERDRGVLLGFLSMLRLSKNKQNEAIDNIYDITKRDGCSISSIVESKKLNDILEDKNLNIPQKARRVRNLLRELRYPKISQAEKDFLKIKRDLDLGDNIKLTPPPSFEGDRYSIEFQFATIRELEDNLRKINSITYNKELRRVIEE